MGNNVGYLTADKKNDECYTPYYAAEPIVKYIPKNKIIWCPFDESWSAFVNELFLNGNKVISSHLNEGLDFFNYEPYYYDIIIILIILYISLSRKYVLMFFYFL